MELALGSSNVQAAILALASSLAAAIVFLAAALAWSGDLRGRRGGWLIRMVLGLLDHPIAVHAGLLLGLIAAGALSGWPLGRSAVCAGAGVVFGVGIGLSTRIAPRRWRLAAAGSIIVLAAASVVLLLEYGILAAAGDAATRAVGLVGGMILYYLFTFAGSSEESELDVGIVAGALGLALAQLQLPPTTRGLVLLLPMGLFFVYSERIRRGLAAFKHVIRGLSHEREARWSDALSHFLRAQEIQRGFELAAAGSWRVHARLGADELAADPRLAELVDPLLCLERARELARREPLSEFHADQAAKLLNLVALRRPDLSRTIGLERAKALLAANRPAEAAALVHELAVRPPQEVFSQKDEERTAIYRLWALALKDPRLIAQGTLHWLDESAGLFAMMAAMRGRLLQSPLDLEAAAFAASGLKKVRLVDYEAHVLATGDGMEWFDHSGCEAAAGSVADSGDVERAVELYRTAERGLPERRLEIWGRIAQLLESKGAPEGPDWLRKIREHALAAGIRQLSEASRGAYFAAVKRLAERALAEGDAEEAVRHYELYAESPGAGVETLRILADLYEQRGEPAAAIRPVELALLYRLGDAEEKEWRRRKERLYQAVTADEVRPRLEALERYFDFRGCWRKARRLYDQKAATEEILRYLDLACLGGGDLLGPVNYLLGLVHLRSGADADAAACFEEVIRRRPKRFSGAEEEETYYSSCRVLGDLYLDRLGRPEKAVECYLLYKDYVKSGAETLFRLAAAYERMGKIAHARKWYDMVLVYPSHPKAQAARDALARLNR